MSRYKKFLAALLTVALLFSLVGCGSEQKKIADTYQNTAQVFIDENNIAAAIKVLEDGIEATHDKELIAMLAKLETGTNESSVDSNVEVTSSSANKNNDFDALGYVGYWTDKGFSSEYGGNMLDVYVESGSLLLTFQSIGPAPMCRVAEFYGEVNLSEIKNSTCSISFDEDGWGNHGVLTVQFNTDSIAYTISEVPENYEAMWGVYNMEGKLFKNDDAWNILNDSGTDDNDYTDEPIYDTSKASGILAQAGITEQQFRENCTPISDKSIIHRYDNSQYTKVSSFDRYHVAYGKQYYSDYEKETGLSMVDTTKFMWDKITADYKNGGTKFEKTAQWGMSWETYHLYKKYGDFDTYLTDTAYAPKGESLIYEASKATFEQMKELPNDYVGKPYVFIGCDIDPSNNYVYNNDNYINTNVTIRDLRDDPSNPNIMSRKKYYLYVTFQGTYVDYKGNIGLNFDLLSLEKIAD